MRSGGIFVRSARRLALVAGLASAVLAVAMPSEAPAATVRADHSFSYTADPGERNEIVGAVTQQDFVLVDEGAPEIRIGPGHGGSITPPCRLKEPRRVACFFDDNEEVYKPEALALNAGDGDDLIDFKLAAQSGAGSNGSCRVDLGPGEDTLRLRGVDCYTTVNAADGQVDVIDCGGTRLRPLPDGGRNLGYSLEIQTEPEDRLINCPPPLPPTPSSTCTPVFPGTIPAPSALPICPGPSVPDLSGSHTQSGRAVRRRGLQVTCALQQIGTCRVEASISRRTARSLGLRVSPRGRRIIVGRAGTAFSAAEGGRRALSVRLVARVRRGLAERHRVRPRVLVTGVARDTEGHESRSRIEVEIRR